MENKNKMNKAQIKKWLKDLDKILIIRKRNIEFINQLKNHKFFCEEMTLKEISDPYLLDDFRLNLFPYLLDDLEVLKNE